MMLWHLRMERCKPWRGVEENGNQRQGESICSALSRYHSVECEVLNVWHAYPAGAQLGSEMAGLWT